MRNKIKALLGVLIAAILAMSIFVGCGENEGENGGDETEVPVDCKLALSQETVTLDILGEKTVKLTATTAEGDFTLFWASDNQSVATVGGGLVTAVAPGTAKITVTCKQKGKNKTLDTKTCTVTVTAPESYYEMQYGQETTKNAEVIKNPGVWHFFSVTDTYLSKWLYSVNSDAYVSFEELSAGKEWYLRYYPKDIAAGTAVDITMDLTLSKEAYVRFGGAGETEVIHYDEGKHSIELKGHTVEAAAAFCITLCNNASGSKSSSLGGDFSFSVEKLTFSPTVSVSQKTATIDLLTEPTLQLSATAPNDEKVTWSSSNEEIATVDETGLVTALAVGEVTITATWGEKSASCDISVLSKTITLSKNAACIDVAAEDKTVTLTAETSDGSEVVWSSADETIATVEGGVVTGVAAGKTEIVATSGSTKKACVVYVMDSSGTYDIIHGNASVAKNAIVCANPGTWYIFDEYNGCTAASYDNGAASAAVISGKTVMFRYQPIFDVGTKYTLTFTVTITTETEEEVTAQTFKYTGTGGNTDGLTEFNEGTRTFTTTSRITADSPFTLQIKLDKASTITISDVVFECVD